MSDWSPTAAWLAEAALHPVTVQVISQGPGIWGSVATGLITAGAAIVGIVLTHRFTQGRERLASEEKRKSEQQFIATELIFKLEQYAEDCARVAADRGERDDQGELRPAVGYPALDFGGVAGDWRTLPPLLMYRIRELPVLHAESLAAVYIVAEHDPFPDHTDSFSERRYQFARLGIRAIILAGRLRDRAGLPGSKLNVSAWSAQPVLLRALRRERQRRAKAAMKRDELDTLDALRDIRAEEGV